MPKIFKNQAGDDCYLLFSGCKAPVSLYDSIKKHMDGKALSTSKSIKLHTFRELCGETYWQGIPSNKMKRLAGMCFRTMVVEKVVTWEYVKYKKSSTNYYRMKH